MDRAVQVAVQIYNETLALYTEKAKSSCDYNEAGSLAESHVAIRYKELSKQLDVLLPWIGSEVIPKDSTVGRDYGVICFSGQAMGPDSPESDGFDLGTHLGLLRRGDKQGRARDAFCAGLTALSSRSEMCWLEAYAEESPTRGHLAHALVDPRSSFRVAFKGNEPKPQLASLLITSNVTLREAFRRMDSGGPLHGWPRGIISKNGTQEFALQRIEKGLSLEPGLGEREPLRDLRPDPLLRELLVANTSVLMVEAYAALAPRKVAKAQHLSEIVKAEMATLLRDAKARGQAVVFQLGGNDPHILAEKVYLRPPFMDHGLRCGYFRWRSSPKTSWAAERPAKDRACIGLQMP